MLWASRRAQASSNTPTITTTTITATPPATASVEEDNADPKRRESKGASESCISPAAAAASSPGSNTSPTSTTTATISHTVKMLSPKMQRTIRINENQVLMLAEKARHDHNYSGYLYKRSSDSNKWQLRWFTLYQVSQVNAFPLSVVMSLLFVCAFRVSDGVFTLSPIKVRQ